MYIYCMEEKELLQGVSDTLTDKPKLTFTVEVKHRTFWDKLLRKPNTRTFTIKSTVVANMYRVSARSLRLKEELVKLIDLSKNSANADIGVTMQLINDHLDDIVYVVAAVIQNDAEEPKASLKNFIRNNFDAEDLMNVLLPTLGSLNLPAFLNSIVLVKGTQGILKPKTSLKEPEEMIAPGV